MMIPLKYFVFATITLLLTISCPGNTRLWNHHPSTSSTTTTGTTTTGTTNDMTSNDMKIHVYIVMELLTIYLATLAMFIVVHYSDPGFLTKEMIDRLSTTTAITTTTTIEDPNTIIEMTRINLDVEYATTTTTAPLIITHNNSTGNNNAMPADNENDDTVSLLESTIINTVTNQEASSQLLVVVDQYVTHRRRKYCTICHIQPLIRSHHCKICQRCVATFDHHCILIGVCIGERNRTRFYIFLLIQAIGFYYCTSIITTSTLGFTTILFPETTTMTTTHHSYVYYYCDAIRVIAAKLMIYPLTLIAYIMLGLHTFFVITNLTTFECTKGPKHLDYLENTEETMDLPFYRGIIQNIYLCCRGDDVCHTSRSRCRLVTCGSQPSTSSPPRTTWTPTLWNKPGPIIRDSPDWWNHPWKNKYWSCC